MWPKLFVQRRSGHTEPWKHQGPAAPTKAVNFKCSLGNTKFYSVHSNERTKHDKITVGM